MKSTTRPTPAIPLEVIDECAVLRPAGYLNARLGGEIERLCSEAIDSGVRYFIIDFADVSTINTIGLSLLMGAIERVHEREGLVYFTALGATDRQVFEALNLSCIAPQFAEVAQAREHIERDRAVAKRTGERHS
jgi:anti-anti-sigma factor